MKYLVILLMFFFLQESPSYSQVNPNCSLFPLSVGNVWVYQYYTSTGQNFRTRTKVDSTIVQNGHRYYRLSNNNSFYRVDSTAANFILYTTSSGCAWSPNEKMIDSLSASLGDSVKIECGTSRIILSQVNIINIFGMNRLKKTYTSMPANSKEYLKGIGLYLAAGGGGHEFWGQTLRGCLINGVLYGDTNLVGINQISGKIPETFILYQNYPNPFNPTTKIRFSIPHSHLEGDKGSDKIVLKIYNILGKEVTTPVNEQLKPGNYEVDWNASDYPSGIYFYKLTANSISLTNKMVLIK